MVDKLSLKEKKDIAKARSEALQTALKVFEKLDLDGDGVLVMDEIRYL